MLDEIRENTEVTTKLLEEIRADRKLTTEAVLRIAATEALLRKWSPRVAWGAAWALVAAMQLGVAPVAEIVKRLIAP